MDFAFNVKNKRALLLFWFFLTGFSVQLYTAGHDHCSNCCPNQAWYSKVINNPTVQGLFISSVLGFSGWITNRFTVDEQEKQAKKELELQRIELQKKEIELKNSDGWVELEMERKRQEVESKFQVIQVDEFRIRSAIRDELVEIKKLINAAQTSEEKALWCRAYFEVLHRHNEVSTRARLAEQDIREQLENTKQQREQKTEEQQV